MRIPAAGLGRVGSPGSPPAARSTAYARFAWGVAFIVGAAAAAGAQHVPASADSTLHPGFQPNVLPVLEVQRATGPIVIDGDMDDPGWQQCRAATNFTEHRPGDNTRPPVETQAFVTYDDNNLYLGFIAHDDPQAVRASLRARDEIFNDDFIGIILDTYGDAAWAYELFVNPLGIAGDLRWTPNNEDMSFDLVFDSRGKVTPHGYQVEMAVPFASLRFPEREEQTWRATFWRTHPRSSRAQYSWAAIDRDEPCFPCQFGTLTGIRGVRRGTNLEILPSVTGSQVGSLRDAGVAGSGLDNRNPDGDIGLNLRYTFTSSLVGDAAINPDFSQVEADAQLIDVNSTFALFYPERRPFFQEGSDLFETFISAVYTRSINDPMAAVKLTGRMNGTSVGYIGGRDEHTPIILPFEEKSDVLVGDRSDANVLRVKQTFSDGSHVGTLFTDRRFRGGGSGTVFGADATLRFLKNYRLEGQWLGSRTREPVAPQFDAQISDSLFARGKHTTRLDGENFNGHAMYASLERDARRWNVNLDYYQTSPTFRADNGFVTQNDNRRAIAWTGVHFRPSSKWFDDIEPQLEVARVWNFANVRKDEWLVPQLFVQFKKQTGFYTNYLWSNELFRGREFNGIRRWYAELWSEYADGFKPGLSFQTGRSIARNIADPVLGDIRQTSLWATVKPVDRLVIRPSYDWARLRHPTTGAAIFDGYILQSRFAYQFTRELFVRLVVQYNDFNHGLDVDPLVTYRVNPFTVFYAGSTHDFREVGAVDPDLTQTERQLFVKLQYLFRI
jgi:hypothetical protein